MNTSELKVVVREIKEGKFIEEKVMSTLAFITYLSILADRPEELDPCSLYEVGNRLYEDGEGCSPTIFFGELNFITSKNGWTLDLVA